MMVPFWVRDLANVAAKVDVDVDVKARSKTTKQNAFQRSLILWKACHAHNMARFVENADNILPRLRLG